MAIITLQHFTGVAIHDTVVPRLHDLGKTAGQTSDAGQGGDEIAGTQGLLKVGNNTTGSLVEVAVDGIDRESGLDHDKSLANGLGSSRLKSALDESQELVGKRDTSEGLLNLFYVLVCTQEVFTYIRA